MPAAALAVTLALGYAGWLAWLVGEEFEGRSWDRPAQVYAAPIELYAGAPLAAAELTDELRRLGYREAGGSFGPGRYRSSAGRLEVVTRPFEHAGEVEPSRHLLIEFAAGQVAGLATAAGQPIALARLDPLLIGSVFPAHGEDRLVLREDEIPEMLLEALKAVEDRRFDRHRGIDLRGIARAALVNLAHREIRQGASTLTQQLVRSFFLTNERTWDRKLREAFMAASLELRYEKAELLHAYVNEVYLGQDGARSIHGFGLASQFYFGKPLGELDLHEVALLVGQVRGPAYYDPRRHPQRALERRNLVLRQMADLDVIGQAAAEAAAARELGVVQRAGSGSYYAAFLDLVRRELERDYPREDLARHGLKVYTTLEPTVQAAAERALVEGLDALGGEAGLDGAVVVTRPRTAEVLAVVGGRRAGFQGFNRALDARRPIGSLIKPVVYLAALETGEYTLASLVDDVPIEVELENGDVWSPRNFDDEPHGTVPLVRALAESFNMATVRLGLDVGVARVANLLERLGLERRVQPYPSLLLGAVELTPLETAQIYNSLANGGFRIPLRVVHSVLDANGETMQQYPLRIEQVSPHETVHQLNEALVQVMERGTGRSVRRQLPGPLVVAGKTGTSDGYRDSWFAGFTNDHAVVTWLGADDNRATGFTGATGAARVWARLVGGLATTSYRALPPADLATTWIDYQAGFPVAEGCPGAVRVTLPAADVPPPVRGCEDSQIGFGNRVRRWFRRE